MVLILPTLPAALLALERLLWVLLIGAGTLLSDVAGEDAVVEEGAVAKLSTTGSCIPSSPLSMVCMFSLANSFMRPSAHTTAKEGVRAVSDSIE